MLPETASPDHSEIEQNGKRTLYGLVTFPTPIYCAREVLGHVEPVRVGGVEGTLGFPSLPSGWGDDPDRAANTPLVAPSEVRTFRDGATDQPLDWGRTREFPSAHSDVGRLLLLFQIPIGDLRESATKVHRAFDAWRDLLIGYVRVLTGQGKVPGIRIEEPSRHLDLFCKAPGYTLERPYDKTPGQVTLYNEGDHNALTLVQLKKACALASTEVPLKLCRSLQLDAYRALCAADYRKAIIEAGVAAETALTDAIVNVFDSTNFPHTKAVLARITMFRNRAQLGDDLGIAVPKEVEKVIVEQRNRLMHRGTSATEKEAREAIVVLDKFLEQLDPLQP